MVVQRCAAWPDEVLQDVGEHVRENHASAGKSAPYALQPDLNFQHVVGTRSLMACRKALIELSRMGREREVGHRAGRDRAAEELGVARKVARKYRAVEEVVGESASIIDEAVAALVAAREPTARARPGERPGQRPCGAA